MPLYLPAGDVPQSLLSGALPTTVILNKRGEIVLRHEGAADYSNPKVEKLLRELVE